MTVAILLMAGEGNRFQSEKPKQFHHLSGKPIYLYALKTMQESKLFDLIILVCPQSHLKKLTSFHKKELKNNSSPIKIISGGKTRQESTYLGLLAAPQNTQLVLIHDAVRPFVTKIILEENLSLAKKHKAVDTCIPSFDTIVHSPRGDQIEKIPLRKEFLRGQTPQTFYYPLILKAHQQALGQPLKSNKETKAKSKLQIKTKTKKKSLCDASDDCQLVLQIGKPVFIAQGDENNIKITTQLDLFLAEQILRLRTLSSSALSSSSSSTSSSAHSSLLINHPLRGKKYIVVGASGGIGTELLKSLRQAGAEPFPVSRSSSFFADLTKPQSLKTALKQIFQKSGPVDGLINLAGFLKVASLKELSESEIENMVQVNLTGLIYACKYASLKEGGHIINIASSSYAKGRAFSPVYSAAKAAVVNFTQALADEHKNLKVNVIVPSRTNTKMRRENFPQDKVSELLAPEKVAEVIVALLKENQTTGSIIEVKK